MARTEDCSFLRHQYIYKVTTCIFNTKMRSLTKNVLDRSVTVHKTNRFKMFIAVHFFRNSRINNIVSNKPAISNKRIGSKKYDVFNNHSLSQKIVLSLIYVLFSKRALSPIIMLSAIRRTLVLISMLAFLLPASNCNIVSFLLYLL